MRRGKRDSLLLLCRADEKLSKPLNVSARWGCPAPVAAAE